MYEELKIGQHYQAVIPRYDIYPFCGPSMLGNTESTIKKNSSDSFQDGNGFVSDKSYHSNESSNNSDDDFQPVRKSLDTDDNLQNLDMDHAAVKYKGTKKLVR